MKPLVATILGAVILAGAAQAQNAAIPTAGVGPVSQLATLHGLDATLAVQRLTAAVGPITPRTCEQHHRSFGVRNSMSPSWRRAQLADCMEIAKANAFRVRASARTKSSRRRPPSSTAAGLS